MDQILDAMAHVKQSVQAVQLIVEQIVQVGVTQIVQVIVVMDAKANAQIHVQVHA